MTPARTVRRASPWGGPVSTSTPCRPVSASRTSPLRQVPRRHRCQRRGRRGPARAADRPGQSDRRRPVRPVRPCGAARSRRRRPVRHRGGGPADAGDVLRDLPARTTSRCTSTAGRPAPDMQTDPGRAAGRSWSAAPGCSGRSVGAVRGAEPLGDALGVRGQGAGGPLTVLDLDYRPMFWSAGPPRRRSWSGRSSTSRWRSATSTSASPRSASGIPHRAAARCWSVGSTWPWSSRARAACSPRPGTRWSRCRRSRCEVVNGLGAGDASAAPHSRPTARAAAGRDDPVRQRGRRDRRVPAGVLHRHADRAEVAELAEQIAVEAVNV